MAADDDHNRDHAEELCQFLMHDIRLEDITLAVPDDLNAGTRKNECQYDWFMWTLHKTLIKAFRGGHFHEIRLAHPAICAANFSVYEFYNVKRIEDSLLEDYRQVQHERKMLYWERYRKAISNDTVRRDALEALHEFERDVWHRAGYTIDRDSGRPGEKGTVLVIRRLARPLKRPQEEVGSSPEGKRSRN